MTLTAEAPGTVETPSPAPAGPPKPRTGVRAIVGWAAVLVALAAAGLLVLLVVNNDSGASRTDFPGIAENGSIRAIEHRDERARVATAERRRRLSPSRAASAPSSTVTNCVAKPR